MGTPSTPQLLVSHSCRLRHNMDMELSGSICLRPAISAEASARTRGRGASFKLDTDTAKVSTVLLRWLISIMNGILASSRGYT
jgi:hypothetical protein